jgi:outer membrane protein OmpA-like peptidoglycan-associated protein
VHFADGASALHADAQTVLREVAELLSERAALCVNVDGHSDDGVADDAALALSRSRAAAVTRALVAAGVGRERIVPRAFGAEFRLRRASDDETRAFNRRVEIVPAY